MFLSHLPAYFYYFGLNQDSMVQNVIFYVCNLCFTYHKYVENMFECLLKPERYYFHIVKTEIRSHSANLLFVSNYKAI